MRRDSFRTLSPGESPPDGVEPRRRKTSHGYVELCWRVAPREYIRCYEHRWVAQCFDPDLQVHHINGVKDDNRIENLEILTDEEHHRAHGRQDKDEIIRLYQSGLSTLQVGERVGMDPPDVWRLLKRTGVTPRSLSEAMRIDVDTDAIERLHRQGASAPLIAKALGVNPSLILLRVRELGLPRHRKGRPTKEEVVVALRAVDEYLATKNEVAA